jgi:hypothetical protein
MEPSIQVEYVVVIGGQQSVVHGPLPAAKLIADSHMKGSSVDCRTNAATSDVERQRLEKLAERVGVLLVEAGWTGSAWKPSFLDTPPDSPPN